jgi:hypothetical protein
MVCSLLIRSFVNEAMVRKLRRDATANVACVTWRDLPQLPIGRRVALSHLDGPALD